MTSFDIPPSFGEVQTWRRSRRRRHRPPITVWQSGPSEYRAEAGRRAFQIYFKEQHGTWVCSRAAGRSGRIDQSVCQSWTEVLQYLDALS